MTKHSSVVGGSTAARVLQCPGSIDLTMGLADEGSVYAAEGTALHMGMEYLLTNDCDNASEVAGMTFGGFKMNRERVNLLQQCLEIFDEIVGDKEFTLEERCEFPGIPGAFGTIDVAIWSGPYLIGGIDWKFGQGVKVSGETSQGKFYLCGLRKNSPGPFQFTVVQPRLDHVETVEYSAKDLDVFQTELSHAVSVSRYANDNLHMGPECRFCRAKAICPKQHEAFEQLKKLQPHASTIGAILDAKADMEALFKEAEKTAHKILEAGGAVPGYKLVQKVGTRAWKDDILAEMRLTRWGLKKGERVTVKVISPAQAEKLLPKRKLDMEDLWEKPDRGLAVAPESDKRPSILTGQSLQDAFAKKMKTTP